MRDRWSRGDLGQGFEIFRDSEGLFNVGYGSRLRRRPVPGARDDSGHIGISREGVDGRALALDTSRRRFASRDRLVLSRDRDGRIAAPRDTRTRLNSGEKVPRDSSEAK